MRNGLYRQRHVTLEDKSTTCKVFHETTKEVGNFTLMRDHDAPDLRLLTDYFFSNNDVVDQIPVLCGSAEFKFGPVRLKVIGYMLPDATFRPL